MTSVGMTGTRDGMTHKQKRIFLWLLRRLDNVNEFHHGDCIGSDYEAALMATALGICTVSHPPKKENVRAFHPSTVIRKQKEYLSRNKDIVNESDVLIVVPKEDTIINKGTRGSGTWATFWFAQEKGKRTIILWHDGQTTRLENDS